MTSKMPTHTLETVEAVWLNESEFCSMDELAEWSGLSQAELNDLVDMGLIQPKPAGGERVIFQQHYLVVARTARRLRDDFELDRHGLAVAVRLLQRIRELEGQLGSARAQLMRGKLSSDT